MTDTKPPDGLVATTFLEKYAEPDSLVAVREQMDTKLVAIGAEHWAELARGLLERAERLQAALLPFAERAMIMANTRMCLKAASRDKEPAGGIWTSDTNNVRLQYTEKLFYDAADAIGRKFVENHLVKVFEQAQVSSEAATERDKHVEAGGKIH